MKTGSIAKASLTLVSVYVVWFLVRLGSLRQTVDAAIAAQMGIDLPWLDILVGLFSLGLVSYLYVSWRNHETSSAIQVLVSLLILIPGALLVALSVASWPQIAPKQAVTDYQLPALLSGDTREEQLGLWEQQRDSLREEFGATVYGKIPGIAVISQSTRLEVGGTYPGLPGQRHQSRLTLRAGSGSIDIDLLYYLPENPKAIFLMANFRGNHSITADPAVRLSTSWLPNNRLLGIDQNRATEQSRGHRSERWPIQAILERGFGLVTFHYADVVPDQREPVYGLPFLLEENQTGAISMWAWGYSRVLDFIHEESLTRELPVIAVGHSRLGKTALWAGVQDDRFDGVISNSSGSMGAALSRRQYGETVDDIMRSFPYWFSPELEHYRNNEQSLPIDQHQLLALVAPRPLYVASAIEDRWADPEGEYLATVAAAEVYALYGLEQEWSERMPPLNSPVGNRLGFHVRKGGHNVTEYDWQQWIGWADRIWPPRLGPH